MLTANQPSLWRRRYDISLDGQHLVRWEPSWWRSGGTFDLDDQRYAVHGNAFGTRFDLIGPAGQPIAAAQRVGRKRWTVKAGAETYQFRRASIWRGDQELLLGDQTIGWIRRPSVWRRSAVAELPGMPEPVEVFVLCVVLAMWERAARAATAASSN